MEASIAFEIPVDVRRWAHEGYASTSAAFVVMVVAEWAVTQGVDSGN